MKRLLLLGGTADGRRLANALYVQGIDVIYSIAGLVRQAELPCEVISGGFTQYGGLLRYMKDNNIAAVLNATHPYANTMTLKAQTACRENNITYWRFMRPAWVAGPGDEWIEVDDWHTLLPLLVDKKSIFITAGQIDADVVSAMQKRAEQGQKQLLRTAVKPEQSLPPGMTWLPATGPFALANERAILARYAIDAIISKNSGGDSTAAKLMAAREAELPVFMFKRPAEAATVHSFSLPDDCMRHVLQHFDA